jgi:hypothetical protein
MLISKLQYYTTVVDIAVALKIANISVNFLKKNQIPAKIFAGNIRPQFLFAASIGTEL